MARKRRAPPRREVTRRRLARWQRERRRRRITITVGALTIALVLAIIGYGYYATRIAPAREWLSTVHGTIRTVEFNAADYLGVVKVLGLSAAPEMPPETPLLMLEQYELMRQGAEELEIEVTDEEVTEQIRLMFEAEDEPLTDEEFQELYHQFLSDWHLSNEEFRWFVEFQLLQGKLDEHFRQEVPEVGEIIPQVHVLGIVVASEEEAEDVVGRLEAGEDFAAVAEEYDQGDGDLGWLPQGLRGKEFDEVAFDPDLELDTVSEPFSTAEGYYIIKVLEREDREIDEDMRGQLQARAFGRWLEEEMGEKVERNPNLDLEKIYQWAMGRIS